MLFRSYDAVEYSVDGVGNVWISSDSEYKYYLNKLPYNGKIYHTGRVRIFAEPYYETVSGFTNMKEGNVIRHGRAQFGTSITTHSSGLPSYWSDINNRKGCEMQSQRLFDKNATFSEPTGTGASGVNNELAKKGTANGIIKRYLSQTTLTESEILQVNKIDPTKNQGVVQSSALVLKGPQFTTTDPKPIDFLTYVYKPLDDAFKHFSTRIRIIGSSVGQIQDENNSVYKKVVPLDGTTYYQLNSQSPNQPVNVSGNSGGISVLLNPETNHGYYFEIISLDGGTSENANIIFYKIGSNTGSGTIPQATPVMLWSGVGDIL